MNVTEFHALGESGTFEGRPCMLIDGEILFMSPINAPHVTAVILAQVALQIAFGPGFVVRVQSPLVLSQTTDPEPDVAVVPGPFRRFAAAHPTSALLVGEVVDSTLTCDLGGKSSLYAAGGIADYWVIDLVDRQLVVHRDPVSDPAGAFAWRYATVTVHDRADTVAPLAAPAGAAILVADLLP